MAVLSEAHGSAIFTAVASALWDAQSLMANFFHSDGACTDQFL